MRILFVNRHTGSRTLPLASAALAAALEHRFGQAVECSILELPPGFSVDDTAGGIRDDAPDVIALTLYSWSRDDLLALAAACRSNGTDPSPPNPVILAGGPETTADPAGVQEHPGIHLAVAGEGESALGDIIAALMEVPRREYVRALGEFPAPMPAPPMDDLNLLPSPWDAVALRGRTWDDYVWELTRGCPFACHFCFESKGAGRVRHKATDRASTELRQLRAMGARRVFLLDPTFNAPPERAKELLRLFIAEAPEIEWHLEVRAEFLDEEQAALYAELGCTLQIGLQTARPEVARNIGRPFSPEEFSRQVLLLHEYGVPYGLDLIWGLPGDTLDGFRGSLDFALSHAPNHLDLFPLAVLPGTRLRDRAGELDLDYRDAPPYTVSRVPGFPPEHLAAAADLARTVDGLYNAGRAVPWFLTACEALDRSPMEFMDDVRADGALSGMPMEERRRPELLASIVERIAAARNRRGIAPALHDVVLYFGLESAGREGLPLPEAVDFHSDPAELERHLDMGVTDPNELAAFVPRNPGRRLVRMESGRIMYRKA